MMIIIKNELIKSVLGSCAILTKYYFINNASMLRRLDFDGDLRGYIATQR